MVARILGALSALWLMVSAMPAQAQWHEASSDHFVIYADQGPDQLRKFADRLERYHRGLEILLSADRPKPSPSNRVIVYMVRSDADVRKLYGDKKSFVQGFYQPRAGGSVAFVPESVSGSGDSLEPYRILFHEYAHHFLIGSTGQGYPLWFSEGFAEFLSSVKFERDGGIGLGAPANHRGYELMLAKPVPIERLLDTAGYLKSKTKAYDEFYGRSWLLFHYLKISGQRQGQLANYVNALRKGKSEMEAASDAFGDLQALDKELDKYLRQSRMNYMPIPASKLVIGDIALRKLDKAEAAIMPVVLRSKRGVDEVTAKLVLPDAKAIAAQYPAHPAVLSALAEAEFDAGNDAAAIAAADKAIAVSPGNINAQLQKGYALARMMESAENPAKAAGAVRAQFLKVNALENDHPIPLIRFYMTFRESGREPTKNAIEGLEWALTLAPHDQGLRMMVASQQMEDEQFVDAQTTLLPLAYSPHESSLTEAAGVLLARAREAQALKEKPVSATNAPKPAAK
jgi:tetratricopeptide (TPR) repeat protein